MTMHERCRLIGGPNHNEMLTWPGVAPERVYIGGKFVKGKLKQEVYIRQHVVY